MIRLLIALSVLSATGCGGSSAVKHVSLSTLEAETKQLGIISYTGSDAEFHYFQTKVGQRYKLDLSAWEMPAAFPADAGIELFVTIRDGKLTAPDPRTMAEQFPSN